LTDDLTRIEGIGPKIQMLLAEKRIRTYRKLAGTKVDRLQKILQDAGGHFHMHDPSTWPDQAQLAADGDWKKLVRLQDSLVGGRRA
jgi:predicted flap endonuclease-1-like 5' DNA nuclease